MTDDTFLEQDQDTERRGEDQDMSDNDGDIEDAEGMETERRTRPNILNKANGAIELNQLEQDYYKKKSYKNKGHFPLN